jgi:hypothetical protein
MLYIEKYEIDPSKQDEVLGMLTDSKEVLQSLDLPFLKDWKVYQSKEDPTKILGGVVCEDMGDIDRLMEVYMKHPKAASVIERFQSLVVEGSLVTKWFDEIISL